MSSFKRIVRFADPSGTQFYGEVADKLVIDETSLVGQLVPVYAGGKPWDTDFVQSGEMKTVQRVLCPLESTPIFMCVGLNYKAHAREVGVPTPAYPTIFIKPPDALAGPYDEIEINAECTQMDYEAELCVILGQDCKDVRQDEDVWPYVLGFTAGNDLSSRFWQDATRSGGQHGSGKWFDKFAPLGPAIVSTNAVEHVQSLTMRSYVNGEERQSTTLGDMIFDIPSIIRHLSRGLTLRAGTVIMTGTPSGVGAFQKPPVWLVDGDTVEVEIEAIGRIRNRIRYAN